MSIWLLMDTNFNGKDPLFHGTGSGKELLQLEKILSFNLLRLGGDIELFLPEGNWRPNRWRRVLRPPIPVT